MAKYPRQAEPAVRRALADTRVVAITGPRQSGKTTLARRFSAAGRVYLTLDDRATLQAARSDPVAFIRDIDRAIIDEVQRAPDILLAIKQSVDDDPRPGRFLVTGSANLTTIATVRDSLAGRIETVTLLPLSGSELQGRVRSTFLDRVMSGGTPRPQESLTRESLIRVVSTGGFPEAIARRAERRRQDWHRAYLGSVLGRDVRDIATLHGGARLPRLVAIASQFAGQLVNLSEIGRETALDHKTVDHYLHVLEQLYLLALLPSWHRNELSRLVKTPKLHFIDSGLLTAQRGYSAARLIKEPSLLGPILEGYVYSELLKGVAVAKERVSIYHYRDRDQLEVDFVLEHGDGRIVGIEAKATASVSRHDFRGLQRLASIAGDRFVQGILLYNGEQTLAFADNMRAVPLPALWA